MLAHRVTLTELLAQPDPPDLVGVRGHGRGYRITRGGDYHRRDAIKLALGVAYLTWCWQEHTDGDVSCVVSVQTQPTLKIVRSA